MKDIKTLEGWNTYADENQNGDFNSYCHVGDLVSSAVVDYFRDILPPLIMQNDYLQVGEAHGFVNLNGSTHETYCTFRRCDNNVWQFCGNCTKGSIYDGKMLESLKDIKDFLEVTYKVGYFGYITTRPHVVYKDGFRMSVQASECLYCTPRENIKTGYTHVEVGMPNIYSKTLHPYIEDISTPFCKSIFPYVPVDIVDQVIVEHGGIDVAGTFGGV